jgi:hypothetical protein
MPTSTVLLCCRIVLRPHWCCSRRMPFDLACLLHSVEVAKFACEAILCLSGVPSLTVTIMISSIQH